MEKASIKKVIWTDIRDKVILVNPRLAHIIDGVNPDHSLPLYVARYPYGSTIVNEGIFHAPEPNGNVVPIDDSRIDPKIREELTYSGTGIPAGVVLQHTMHEALVTCSQALPLGVVAPGSIFSLWKKFDSEPSFHPIHMFAITAGARFIFMVPNISNLISHKNLKRDFNLRMPPPKSLLEQWEIFKALAHHPTTKCDWAVELFFFSKKWFEKIKNDSAWQSLKLLMLEIIWKKSAYERNDTLYNLAFSRAQANRNLKPNPYLADTVKHLFMMSAGVVPGFSAAIDEMCAPNELLRKIYIESYGLTYNPTIFLPVHFDIGNKEKFIYYSMTLPTTLEFSPKSRKISSTINELSELKHVMHIYLDEIKNKKLKIEDTIIGKIADEVEFEFFHSKPDCHGEIKPTYKMTEGDPSLLYCSHNSKIKTFADSGTPIRGCVRIAAKR